MKTERLMGWFMVGVLVASLSVADGFFLRDKESGAMYGPFRMQVGETIRVGERAYSVIRLGTTVSANETEKRMKQIIIPEINFRQANVKDIIDFLRVASIEFDTSKRPKTEKGVNLIINPKGWTKAQESGITFKGRQLSLHEVLKVVTQIAGLQFRIDGSIVMIEPKPEEEKDGR